MPGDPVGLAQALTRIDSRNPTLSPGAPGEEPVARHLAETLSRWGFRVNLEEAAPGRPNVTACIGPEETPALMFAGHLDTVGIEGMTHDPFDASIRDSRIYGRGAADMKAGVAAMCVAASEAARLAGRNARRQIIIAAVADEEYESLGMRALVARGTSAECAIVTEPTRLAICPAHRGFAWIEVEFTGRAAHGSRYDIGVDAIRHAGLVLAELDRLDAGELRSHTHALLGRASLHASTISGGIGMSTYPDHCVLSIERRTLPGESVEQAMREITEACERVRHARPELSASIRLIASQVPSDVDTGAPVVKALERCLALEGMPAPVEGLSAWTDAAILNEAGIPAICFGPGDIALAHAAEEFVPVGEIRQAAAVLTRVGIEWMAETS